MIDFSQPPTWRVWAALIVFGVSVVTGSLVASCAVPEMREVAEGRFAVEYLPRMGVYLLEDRDHERCALVSEFGGILEWPCS